MRPIRSSRLRKKILFSVFLLFPCALKAQVEPQTTEEPADVPILTLTFEEIVGQVGQEISLPLKITSSTSLKEPFQIILRADGHFHASRALLYDPTRPRVTAGSGAHDGSRSSAMGQPVRIRPRRVGQPRVIQQRLHVGACEQFTL